MCDRCAAFDRQIAHYRDMATLITDAAVLDGIAELIDQAERRKQALHFQAGDVSLQRGT